MTVEMPSDILDRDVVGMDDAIGKIAMALSERKHPELLTELSDEEVKNISILLTIATEEELDFLVTFVENFIRLRVSLNRKGVKEIIELTKGTQQPEKQMREKLKNMFLGLK